MHPEISLLGVAAVCERVGISRPTLYRLLKAGRFPTPCYPGGIRTFAAALAVAVAKGGQFLGRQCREGPVLMFAMEEIPGAHLKRLRDLGATNDTPIYSCVGYLETGFDRLEWVRRLIQAHGPQLVILDTLWRVILPENGNDNAELTRLFEPWLALARSTDAHLMFVVHSRKSGGEFGLSILGSTAIAAAVDVLLTISRDDDGSTRYLSTEARYGESIEKTVLAFDESTGEVSLGSTKAGMVDDRIRRDIINRVDSSAEPVKHQDLVKAVTGKAERVRAIIKTLVDEGVIELIPGIRGNSYRSPLNEPVPQSQPVPDWGLVGNRASPAVPPTGGRTAGTG